MVAQLKQELATLKANSEQVQQSRSQDEVIVGTLQRRLEEANASCAEAAAVSEHRYQELLMLKSDFAAAQDAWQAQQREAEAMVAQLMQELATLKANSEQVQQSRSQDEVIVGTLQRRLEEANASCAEAAAVSEHRYQELLMLKSDFAAAQDAWQVQQREAEAIVAQLKQELATLKANSEQVQQSRSQDEVIVGTLQRRLEEANASCAEAAAVSEHRYQELLMLKSDFAAAQDAWQAQQREAEAVVAQLMQELATLKANSEQVQVQQSRSQDEVIVGTLQRRLEEANASCAEAAAVSEHRYQELLMLKTRAQPETARTACEVQHGVSRSDFAAAQDAWQAQQREAEAVVAQLMQELATLKANSEQVQVQQSRSQDEVIVGTRERTLEEANAPGAEAEVVLEHRHQANLEQAQQSAGQDQVLASAPQERLDDASRAEAAAVGQDPNSAPNEGSISTGVQMSSTSGTPTSAAPTLLTEQRRRPSQALKDCAQSGSLCREVQATDGGLWQCEGVLNFGLSGEAKARLKASNRQAEEDADRSKELAEELRAKYRQHYGHEPKAVKDKVQQCSFYNVHGPCCAQLSFEWIFHLRYYWEVDDSRPVLAEVKCVQTSIPYGYEYLVTTPLTDMHGSQSCIPVLHHSDGPSEVLRQAKLLLAELSEQVFEHRFAQTQVFCQEVAKAVRVCVKETGVDKPFSAKVTSEMIARGKYMLRHFGPVSENCALLLDGYVAGGTAVTSARRNFPKHSLQ
ncbi:rbcL [Symbiodinium sp. CCMP2592]|nr:rbcL [Symbiodinium sp. CCMP2592]